MHFSMCNTVIIVWIIDQFSNQSTTNYYASGNQWMQLICKNYKWTTSWLSKRCIQKHVNSVYLSTALHESCNSHISIANYYIDINQKYRQKRGFYVFSTMLLFFHYTFQTSERMYLIEQEYHMRVKELNNVNGIAFILTVIHQWNYL